MNNSPRLKLLTLCIGAALAQMASLPVLADTAVGVDTVNGNAANPGYLSGSSQHLDEEMAAGVKRSPSGQLYSIPKVDEDVKGQVSGSIDLGYLHESDQKSYAKRKEYSDPKNGLYLNNFNVSSDLEGARYFNVNAGGVGRRDQFYDVTTGKYGSWKVRAFYNETLHVFTDTWKSFYNGEGTGNLTIGLPQPTMYISPVAHSFVSGETITLPGGGAATYIGANVAINATTLPLGGCTAIAPCWQYGNNIYSNAAAMAGVNGTTGTVANNGLTGAAAAVVTSGPQSNMAAAIATRLAGINYSELSLVRKKGGVRGDITLTDSVKAYASYTLEKRTGARPFAMNDGNISTEIAEPIDYKTHDILAGLSYSDELTQANLRASGSFFRNNISTLNVESALMGSATNGFIQHQTFALAPNNDAYNVKGEFARSLPDLWKGRFTAAASWGTNRQNDALLAPISDAQNADLAAAGVTTLNGVNPGYIANSINVNQWNTTAALSQQTAKQRIDNKMVNLGLSLKPLDDLSVRGSYRFFDTANKGGYVAYNPLTGQFGRGPSTGNGAGAADLVIGVNAAGTGCYTPAGYPAVAGCTLPTLGNTLLTQNALTGYSPLANGSNVAVFGQARSTKQTNVVLAADYDISRTSSLSATLERENFDRDFRERAKTWEDKLKLTFVDRSLGDVTLRASLEHTKKRGSDYRFRTFEDLGTGLPGLDIATANAIGVGLTQINPASIAANTLTPVTVNGFTYYLYKNTGAAITAAQAGTNPAANTTIPVATTNLGGVAAAKGTTAVPVLTVIGVTVNGLFYAAPNANLYNRYSTMFRKYDQADRDQNILNTRVNMMASDVLDVGVNMQVKRATYPDSFYGLKRDNQDSLGFDLNFQPSVDRIITAFYNYQHGMKSMYLNSGIAATACTTYGQIFSAATCADTSGGNTGARPLSEIWSSNITDRNDVAGLGWQEDLGFAHLGVDYTFAKSRTHVAYDIGSAALANPANGAALAALAGTALPDMTTVQHTITVNLVKALDKRTSIRAMYRHDGMKVTDWHYDGVIKNVMAAYDSGTMLLDAGSMNYHVNTIGVMLNYKL